MKNIIIPELRNSKIRRTDEGLISVYDLIKVCGEKKGQRKLWMRLSEQFPNTVQKCHSVKFGRVDGKKANLPSPACTEEVALEIMGLLPGAIGDKYREGAANLVRRYIEGDADLGLEIMIRDRNKDNYERVKRRMQVLETNKEVAKIVSANPGTRYSDVHNDRYKGLYGKNASQLRSECGAKPKETPLNYMSELDLTMNSLANQIAIELNNPSTINLAAMNISKAYRESTGKVREVNWEEFCLPPAKARKQLHAHQMELPL